MNNKREQIIKNNWWNKIFGSKEFIVIMFLLFLPSALQQLVTTSVTYIDTFFIAGFAPNSFGTTSIEALGPGAIGKTAVGIATAIVNFPLMVIFGVTTGIGIVTAQYYGAKDINKTQQTIIYKILVGLICILPFIILMMVMPERLVAVSTNEFNLQADTFNYYVNKAASTYLFWSGPSFIFILLAYSLSYSYREIGKPKYALIASIISVISNIILDPLLIIFETDLNNAIRNIALSTMLSRFIEFLVMFIFIYAKKEQYLMIVKIKLEWAVFKNTIKNSWQPILNDALYGLATLFLVICLLVYSRTYHDAFTTVAIIIQFAAVIFPGMAASSSVLVGNELGKNNIKEAKKNSIYLIVWSSIITFGFAIILFILSWFINPLLSPSPVITSGSETPGGTQQLEIWKENQVLAQKLEWIMMPVIFSQGLFSILYFSIKSGGSKYIFFTDGFVMVIWCIVLGSLIYTKTINEKNMSPALIFFLIELNQIVKAIFSLFIYLFSNWAQNITDDKNNNINIENNN